MYTISGHISNACPPNPMANLKNYNVIFAQPARNQLWLTLGVFLHKARSVYPVCMCVCPCLQYFRTLHLSSSHPLCSWPPSAQLLEGDASRQRAPKKQQLTSKEFHWWNMIINLYPMSLEYSLHPSITHWHEEGKEKRGWFAKYNTDHKLISYSSYFCFSFFFWLHDDSLKAIYYGCMNTPRHHSKQFHYIQSKLWTGCSQSSLSAPEELSNKEQTTSWNELISYSKPKGWSPKVRSALPNFKRLCSAHALVAVRSGTWNSVGSDRR